MATQFDDVVKDAKRSAKEEIAGYLKRQNGSSTVIDKLIKAVNDIHQNKQLMNPPSKNFSSYSAALRDLATICWRGPRRHDHGSRHRGNLFHGAVRLIRRGLRSRRRCRKHRKSLQARSRRVLKWADK